MTTLTELAERQRIWSERNFPDRRPDHAAMGMIEELGELAEAIDWSDSPIEYVMVAAMMRYLGRLAHIHLKREQGIRKLSTAQSRLETTANQLVAAVLEYHCIEEVEPDGTVILEDFIPDELKEVDAMGDIFIYWLDRCNRRGQDAESIAEWTLKSVLARDWVQSPDTGVAVVTA